MKTKHLRWLWPLLLLPVFRQGAVAQTETPKDTVVISDTLRWTWTAKADEVKTFSFSVREPGHYRIWWGDGDMNDYFIHGTVYERTHRYLLDGSYQVRVFGIGAATPEDYEYTETAFGIKMKMVYVEGGTFQMGATPEQGSEATSNEKPVHDVTLDGFYIGETEVTQAQWKAVMGKYSSTSTSSSFLDCYPAERILWIEAVEFCEKLSRLTGRRYRLPTEAEWEYAARGGQHTDGTKYAGSSSIGDVAWYRPISSVPSPIGPVKMMKANGLGLYDMSGNVSEWCSDWYGSDYYSSSPATNPQGPSSGSYRVLRGGCYNSLAERCRVSFRDYNPGPYSYFGFRVVCDCDL